MTIPTRFRSNIEKYNLITKKDTIIVGASGGPDSQLLVHLLAAIKDEYDLNIVLAHLNHMHRQEAINDENMLIKTANELCLDVKVRRASMDAYAKEMKISPEDAGRRLRYQFFYDLAKEYESCKIAVAHNKDDQAETILMRLIRGTGLDGLKGMDFKKDKIIRPLLNFEKKEILAYLNENNISYAIDKTNFSNDYTRNYIRNEIMPKLEEVNPKAIENIFNLAVLAKNDIEIIESSIEKLAKKIFTIISKDEVVFDKDLFEALSYPYQSRLVRIAIANIRGSTKDFSKDNVDVFLSLINLDNGKKIIKDDLKFIKSYKSYSLSKIKEVDPVSKEVFIGLGESKTLDCFNISVSLVDKKEKSKANIAYFDFEKLSFPLEVRFRKNGDRFRPLGLGHSKKIKDFFIDEKIDRQKREQIPLIISDQKIIWVCGYRTSEEAKLTKSTKKIVKIEVSND